jgi:hypothetical protein
MLNYRDLDSNKKAFIFELDNVLYPERDYLLQVYYLFANFIEFTEGFPPASDIVYFFKNAYLHHGDDGIFDRLKEEFDLDEKYRENFIRLYSTARLPLKLLLFSNVLSLLQDIINDKKDIIILTKGVPDVQINKIMQTEWNGLEKYLKVYYVREIVPELDFDALSYIMKKNNFIKQDLLILGSEESDIEFTQYSDIDYVNINQFI